MILVDLDDVGRLVRQRRQDLSMSQTELAERAGITRQLLSRFEQGRSDPPLSTTLRLMRELGMSLDVRTRADRASVVEIRIPQIDPSALRMPRLDAAAMQALQGAVRSVQANTALTVRQLNRINAQVLRTEDPGGDGD